MDHQKAYAHHIAQAIRHKKAMKAEPEEDLIPELDTLEEGLPPDESPADDPKSVRKERIKAILSR